MVGKYLVSAGQDDVIIFWDIEHYKEIKRIVKPALKSENSFTGFALPRLYIRTVLSYPPLIKISLSPASSFDGNIRLIDAETSDIILLDNAHKKPVISMSVSKDGKYLVSAIPSF